MARSFALLAAQVAMLMVVEFASIADAKYKSYLGVYEAPGCCRRSEEYYRCGCHNLKYNGGFKHGYCYGYGRMLPREDRNRCRPSPCKSVYIKY